MSLQSNSLLLASKRVTYATWNPSDKNANVTLSNGNLTAAGNNSSFYYPVRATIGKSTGKWYWEEFIDMAALSGFNYQVSGVGNSSASLANGQYVGANVNSWAYHNLNGNKYTNAVNTAYGATYITGVTIGIALDMTNGAIYFAKNNAWQNGGDPTSGAAKTGAAYTGLTGTLYPMTSFLGQNNSTGSKNTANFGATALTYAAPSGYNSGVFQ
jgi:hypothetical protein